ncbi:MAG: hypothetical protein AAB958_01310, partial [Patescibacteria group bacterium]
MVTFIKQNILILALILILSLYLGVKSFENGWDGWGFGSAQTLMSSQYWARDGFAKNYFLFIPSPYSKLIKYIDEPEFRNRTIDNFDGALKRNRIYYTHYPPLYLAPYALLTKIGVENRAVFRIFSILISLAALFLFYLFIKLISTTTIAAVASVYYGLSVTFLNYADSISIQPWTIFFTFLILYLSVLAGRDFENKKIYQKYNLAIWIVYFALSLSSYDATFFVLAWLILYDAIILKKFLWLRWLFFALAPIFGFALQILQNIWYLGATEMWQDIYNSYTGRAIGTLKGFVSGLVAPFVSMTGLKTFFFFKKSVVTIGSAALILAILKYFHNSNYGSKIKLQINHDFFKIILILAVAAVVQPFFINVTGHWPYQGVLTAPFWGLLIGLASILLLQYIAVLKYSKEKLWFIILFVVILGLWSIRFYDTLGYVKDWPNNKPAQEVIEFGKSIKLIAPNEEKIVFRIIPQNTIWKSQFPVFNMEYYIGMPAIDFANINDLLVDFWWFQNRSEYPFYSFVIAENRTEIENLRNEIKKTMKNSI